MFGYAEAIAQRFEEINRIASRDADAGRDQSDGDDPLCNTGSSSTSSGTDLVVRARKERVDAHFAGLGVRNRARRVSGGHGGHHHGHAAGMSADLTGGSRRVGGSGGELTS